MVEYKYPSLGKNKRALRNRLAVTVMCVFYAFLVYLRAPDSYEINLFFWVGFTLISIVLSWFLTKWFQKTQSQSVITLTDDYIKEQLYNGEQIEIPFNLIEEVKEEKQCLVVKKKYTADPVNIIIRNDITGYDTIKTKLLNLTTLKEPK